MLQLTPVYDEAVWGPAAMVQPMNARNRNTIHFMEHAPFYRVTTTCRQATGFPSWYRMIKDVPPAAN